MLLLVLFLVPGLHLGRHRRRARAPDAGPAAGHAAAAVADRRSASSPRPSPSSPCWWWPGAVPRRGLPDRRCDHRRRAEGRARRPVHRPGGRRLTSAAPRCSAACRSPPWWPTPRAAPAPGHVHRLGRAARIDESRQRRRTDRRGVLLANPLVPGRRRAGRRRRLQRTSPRRSTGWTGAPRPTFSAVQDRVRGQLRRRGRRGRFAGAGRLGGRGPTADHRLRRVRQPGRSRPTTTASRSGPPRRSPVRHRRAAAIAVERLRTPAGMSERMRHDGVRPIASPPCGPPAAGVGRRHRRSPGAPVAARVGLVGSASWSRSGGPSRSPWPSALAAAVARSWSPPCCGSRPVAARLPTAARTPATPSPPPSRWRHRRRAAPVVLRGPRPGHRRHRPATPCRCPGPPPAAARAGWRRRRSARRCAEPPGRGPRRTGGRSQAAIDELADELREGRRARRGPGGQRGPTGRGRGSSELAEELDEADSLEEAEQAWPSTAERPPRSRCPQTGWRAGRTRGLERRSRPSPCRRPRRSADRAARAAAEASRHAPEEQAASPSSSPSWPRARRSATRRWPRRWPTAAGALESGDVAAAQAALGEAAPPRRAAAAVEAQDAAAAGAARSAMPAPPRRRAEGEARARRRPGARPREGQGRAARPGPARATGQGQGKARGKAKARARAKGRARARGGAGPGQPGRGNPSGNAAGPTARHRSGPGRPGPAPRLGRNNPSTGLDTTGDEPPSATPATSSTPGTDYAGEPGRPSARRTAATSGRPARRRPPGRRRCPADPATERALDSTGRRAPALQATGADLPTPTPDRGTTRRDAPTTTPPSPGHRGRDRQGHRRPERPGPHGAHLPALRGPRPARGRARAGQDPAGQDAGRQALDLDFSRIQFTPDLMPADIIGTKVLEETPTAGAFEFHPGRSSPAGAGRRDQPGHAEDAVGAARGHAGAAGHRRGATRCPGRSS